MEIYTHEVFAKKNLDWGYENLSTDFYEEALDQIKKSFQEIKNKTLKAHRNIDLLTEAFPEDKYDIV